MKGIIILLTLFTAFCGFGQNEAALVQFNLNFEHIKSAQNRINGVLFDGRNYIQIRQGKGSAGFSPGEHSIDVKIAVTGTQDQFEKTVAITVKKKDTVTIDILIPDSYLPHFSSISFIDREGKYYAQNENDTLNCVDSKGRKWGLWFMQKTRSEDCVDQLEYIYDIYHGNIVSYTLRFRFDYNNCEVKPYVLTITKHKTVSSERVLHQFEIDRGYGTGLNPEEKSGFDHNQCDHSDIKWMLRQLMTNDFEQKIPTYIRNKKLNGTYRYTIGEQKAVVEDF